MSGEKLKIRNGKGEETRVSKRTLPSFAALSLALSLGACPPVGASEFGKLTARATLDGMITVFDYEDNLDVDSMTSYFLKDGVVKVQSSAWRIPKDNALSHEGICRLNAGVPLEKWDSLVDDAKDIPGMFVSDIEGIIGRVEGIAGKLNPEVVNVPPVREQSGPKLEFVKRKEALVSVVFLTGPEIRSRRAVDDTVFPRVEQEAKSSERTVLDFSGVRYVSVPSMDEFLRLSEGKGVSFRGMSQAVENIRRIAERGRSVGKGRR